jgi:hypothetical protein
MIRFKPKLTLLLVLSIILFNLGYIIEKNKERENFINSVNAKIGKFYVNPTGILSNKIEWKKIEINEF